MSGKPSICCTDTVAMLCRIAVLPEQIGFCIILCFVDVSTKNRGGGGTTVAQWLRCCATNRKVAGSIPAGVSGFFIDIKSFLSHCGPGVDSASNRYEYREYFLGVKVAGV